MIIPAGLTLNQFILFTILKLHVHIQRSPPQGHLPRTSCIPCVNRPATAQREKRYTRVPIAKKKWEGGEDVNTYGVDMLIFCELTELLFDSLNKKFSFLVYSMSVQTTIDAGVLVCSYHLGSFNNILLSSPMKKSRRSKVSGGISFHSMVYHSVS